MLDHVSRNDIILNFKLGLISNFVGNTVQKIINVCTIIIMLSSSNRKSHIWARDKTTVIEVYEHANQQIEMDLGKAHQ